MSFDMGAEFEQYRTCKSCALEIPESGFYKRREGCYRGECIDCRRKARSADYRSKKQQYRTRHLRCVFKIKDLDYEGMLESQNWSCLICGITQAAEQASTGKSLCVDHDHETGKIRGLLCGNCNKGLGNFQDNPRLLVKAADYLEGHKNGGSADV